jgi:shikimate dehydrogenase
VTAPFKEETAALVDELDPAARAAGAVNAVVLKGGASRGYNTDLFGVAEALRESGLPLAGARVLVVGTGGAARAAVCALTSAGSQVLVAGRDEGKARSLAESFGAEPAAAAPPWVARILKSCHALVSCLSTREPVIPPEALHPRLTVLDAYYASESALVRDAYAAGCRVVDGREWLLHQGAVSFRLFAGRSVPLEALRGGLAASPSAERRPNVALVGFMGAGKDSVARCLSARTGWPVLDVDAEIRREAGMAIPEIFARLGEPAFRDLESGVLGRLAGVERHVVNAGGGAVLRPENCAVLRERCTVVWLWAGLETSLARAPGDGSRPLLAGEERERRALERFEERLPLYAGAADLMLPTESAGPDALAERILDEIRHAFGGLG